MKIVLTYIRQSRSHKSQELAKVIGEYLQRCQRIIPAALLPCSSSQEVMKLRERPATYLILLDSKGKQVTSEGFAATLSQLQNGGKRDLILAIGPADGWNDAERNQADMLLSLSPMTFPHELAVLILSEQVWRACAILSNHPYHSGH